MLANPSLLIVDDEESICQGCRRIFTRQGFRVDVSSRSPEGLSLAEEREYSAIVLDINMPSLDGIAFLKELRRTRPEVPVIFITGYPSLPKATSAVRLGASDFVTKPFTPQDITEAVNRSIEVKKQAAESETEPEKDENALPGLSPWKNKDSQFRFVGETWVLAGEDQTYRMGTVLPPMKKAEHATIRLPKIGETVYEGLPWAMIESEGGTRTLRAAVTGTVVEVNAELREGLEAIWGDPCGQGWIVRVSPNSLAGVDLNHATKTRNVAILGKQSEPIGSMVAMLSATGCSVSLCPSLNQLQEADANLVVFDATSFGEAGPEMVDAVALAVPGAKVMVIAASDADLEADYRRHRLFYYAVEPIDRQELTEVLDNVFCPTAGKAVARPSATTDPNARCLSGIQIRNRLGHQVRLLIEDGLLLPDAGLGQRVREKLLARLLPVETMLGQGDVAQLTILEAAKKYEHVLILTARDMGRPVGSLVVESKDDLVQLADMTVAGRVTTLTIQPVTETDKLAGLGESIIEALASHIAVAMADG